MAAEIRRRDGETESNDGGVRFESSVRDLRLWDVFGSMGSNGSFKLAVIVRLSSLEPR
jgi:hypothetical protein